MNCERARHLIPEWVDGRVEGPDRDELQVHLKGCGPCREEERLQRSTWVLLGDYPSVEPKPGFVARLLARLRRPPLWRVLGPVAAAAAVLVVTLLFVLQPDPQVPPIPVDPPITAEEQELLDHLELLENYDAISTLEMVAPESNGEAGSSIFQEDHK